MKIRSIFNRILSAAVCGVIIYFLMSPAYAATYYVSTSGNDASSGSADAPWRTIQKCANTISGGDTCIVRGGIYTEDVTISRSGSAGNILHFQAENKHEAIVTGILYMSNSGNYVKIEGFKVVMPNGGQWGIRSLGNNNQIVDNLITTNSDSLGLSNTGIAVEGSYCLVDRNYVEKVCLGYQLQGSNSVFQNNEATLLKLNGGNCGDVDYMRFFGANQLIKNNYFHGVNMNEIGQAHVDCFQTFDNLGPQWSITNVTIEGNYCSDAHQGMMLEGRVFGLSDGLTIRNNIFKNCSAWGLCAHKIRNVKVFNNTFDMTGGIHGMGCREESSCEVKNNIFYNANSLYWFENSTIIDGTTDSPGKNNLLYKAGIAIIGFSGDIKNQDPLFVNRGLNNYRLKAESPARDAGIAINGWTSPVDKDAVSRPQGPYWDIGAYEYRGTSIIPPQNFRKTGQ